MQPKRIFVVGSLNIDLVTEIQRLPRPGETLSGSDLLLVPGGKGANQVCAAARLGVPVTVHVGIGTDVSYVSRNEKTERAKVPRRADGSAVSPQGPRWEHLWPKDDYQATLDGEKSLAWSNWPIFTIGLVQRGHSDDDIRKILGGNVMRVVRANA